MISKQICCLVFSWQCCCALVSSHNSSSSIYFAAQIMF
uniref:Uncharacterized protein n=1 Tax=Arundo donax TaxID=35708 RepID=A0A0A8ZYF3_ARUDO